MKTSYFTKKDFNFMKVALLSDKNTGTIFRSSSYVVNGVLEIINNKPLRQIIEYGPGDGVLTCELLKCLPPDGKLLAVEIDPKFLQMLRAISDPRLSVIDGKMQNVCQNIKAYDFNNVDLIVSSIPFSLLSKIERETVVSSTKNALAPDGMFIVFHQYSHIMAKPLRKFFGEVNIKFEIRNFFPCFIISAKKSSLLK
ncbi:hypothetical protein A2818_01090 [Candidatus Nomurabacteria bacterium RIFCSPHIGHO2_01_FULL_40_12]|uniref:Ribosomal RNA adenine methylase transferase N-terminal domain-containing protein n=1 Tax=Candidatus Nomurabacteria bacterium RIFCSPHIGHO2_01_FULL_40_12 TaxID=1801737 RepID=A0A1F6UYV1_9BACT|nr:MAG: hypothetical protein A2818_01090 [Candidatus Nomurabacteria bacterium RIFCSPHIGHO2_01_FULL_40_12]